MLTVKQKKWIARLPDDDKIEILPFDESSQKKFLKIKKKIKNRISESLRVEHRGSTSLRIAGQNEIDIYIPVSASVFNKNILVPKLAKIFGQPKSYHQTRIRFRAVEHDKKIDIFLINKESNEWLNGIKFENYLKTNVKTLREYEKLKQSCLGFSTKKYYEKKVAFINNILSHKTIPKI